MAGLVIVILVILLILISFFILMVQVGKMHYNVIGESAVSKKAKEDYLNEFPNYTEEDVKDEIGTIANILIANEPSNRYTEIVREKAHKDKNIENIKDAFLDDVDIVKYNNGNMKAKLKFKNLDTAYSMVMSLSTVTKGRLFLDDYSIYKESLNEG